MSKTIVGCFDSATEARAVEAELIAEGLDSSRIHMMSQSSQRSAQQDEPGIWESIKDAFGFADESDRATYGEAARRGSTIVSVDADDARADEIATVMRRHHVVDLDARTDQWRQQGWAGVQSAGSLQAGKTGAQGSAGRQASTVRQGKETIPVVEEELRVGKRPVQKGGVRVYSHVTERPIEEKVQLREEHVNVERRPVDRPVTNADQAFRERAIEARESAEEAVVDKKARVVEEVTLNKDVQQREQTIRDKVRRTDVDVEKMPAGTSSGMQFSDTFINELAADERYRGREWTSLEPEFRQSFEQRYPTSRWDDYRDRIRSGYDRMRRR